MTSVTHKVATDTLAGRLLLLRREMGWRSQRDAAEATGVPFGTWQGMEAGRDTRALDRHIAKIAEASGYDREWLMWGGPLNPLKFAPPPLRKARPTRGYDAYPLELACAA